MSSVTAEKDKPNGYDKDLQMFKYPPREPRVTHLIFLRWLVEEGMLEGDGRIQSPSPDNWFERAKEAVRRGQA